MNELTLKSLATRMAELERKLAESSLPGKKDWRRGIGTMEDITRAMLAAIEENSEAERLAALEEAE